MVFFYRIFLFFYRLLITLASPFHAKAKQAREGRKKTLDVLFNTLEGHQNPLAWFHAASLGEFEQGLPIMKAYRSSYPDHKILVTFFSPSGFNHRKDHPIADYTAYLPWDSPRQAKQFVQYVNPKHVFFIKYEFWYFLLKAIHRQRIPLYSIAARFVPKQVFFKGYGGLHRRMLTFFDHIFVQDKNSYDLLHSIGIDKASVSGDPRFDNVMEQAQAASPIPTIASFKGNQKLLIIGSAWMEDIAVLQHTLNSLPEGVKVLIAPHDVSRTNCKRIADAINQPHCLFSSSKETDAQVMILDTIGHLAKAYQYADLAYIGGAFGDGLHNLLEATAFGAPVVFGSKGLEKFPEALELIDRQGAYAIADAAEAKSILNKFLEEKEFLDRTKQICLAFMKEKQGATETIMQYLEKSR